MQGILTQFGAFIENQFTIALSLVTTLENLTDPSLPDQLQQAFWDYFFAEQGYTLVGGAHIIPPMRISDVPADLASPAKLRSLLSKKSGEQYVRDLISVTVEATGEVQYGINTRYQNMITALAGQQLTNAKQFFQGYASMAEAAVTSAIEQATLGIAQFQTNPILAAAAGTFGGTAARKMTEHVYLSEMGF